MTDLTLAERRRKLGEEIAAAQERARYRDDLVEIGVGDILKELNHDVASLGADDHEGIVHAETRLAEVHRHLDSPPRQTDG